MLLCATHPRDFYLCRGNIDSFDFAMLSYVVLLNKYCEHYLTKYWCILQRTIMITFGMMFLCLTDPYDLYICVRILTALNLALVSHVVLLNKTKS